MDITLLYSLCSLFFLGSVYPAQGIRNTIGHVPKVHRNQGHDVTSGHSREPATLNEEMIATVSRATVSDVELTNSIGNILTDEELEAFMPYLAKSTWFPINSHKGFRKKNGHGGKAKHLSGKFGENDRQTKTGHERRKQFRVKGLENILEAQKGHRTSDKKHNFHGRHDTKSHPSSGKDNVIRRQYDTDVPHQTTPQGEDYSSVFQRNHPRHNNHLPLLPSVVETVQPPTNRRHHKGHLSNSAALSNRNHDNSVHLGKKTNRDIGMLLEIDGTEPSSDSTNTRGEEKTSKQKSYIEAVENWRRKAAERILSGASCECDNGGSCILKVVCVCPPEYYGIRCQHRLHHHSCGDVKHGTWIRNGCNLCRCEDGNMLCVTSDIEGCAEEFDEREEILEPETIDTEFDSYIDSSGTNVEEKEDAQDYASYDTSDILTLEYQMIPLPSSAHSFTVVIPSLLGLVATVLVGAYIQV